MTLAYPLEDPRGARPSTALIGILDRLGAHTAYARNAEIYAQEDEAQMLYRVVSGVVRTSRLALDGRRRVSGFYYPDDLFGLEAGPLHDHSAEALSDCQVQAVRRSSVRAFAGDRELDRAILEATRRELQRAQNHVQLLGQRGARERVAAFLMALAQGEPGGDVDLPMTRQDMADYLGLTIETVSRMLTLLQSEDIVRFPSARRFRISRWEALEPQPA